MIEEVSRCRDAVSTSISSQKRADFNFDGSTFAQALLSLIDADDGRVAEVATWCANQMEREPTASSLLSLAWIDRLTGSRLLQHWMISKEWQIPAIVFALDLGMTQYQDVAVEIRSSSRALANAKDFITAWSSINPVKAAAGSSKVPAPTDAQLAHATFVVGFSGSGKTTVSTWLSDIGRYLVHQCDEEIAREQGVPMADLFRSLGATAVQEIYESHIKSFLSTERGSSVVVLGSSACMSQGVRRILSRSSRVVWLDCNEDTALVRLRTASEHAAHMLATAPDDVFSCIKLVRDSTFYGASVRIMSDDVSVAELVWRIGEAFERL